MKLFPAIDLLGGRAVRLAQGDRARATVYHERPLALVDALAADGADRLHVVDLDGAFGEPRQDALVAAIVAASPIPVEVGGGLRDRAAIERAAPGTAAPGTGGKATESALTAHVLPPTTEGDRALLPVVAKGTAEIADILNRSNADMDVIAACIREIGSDYGDIWGPQPAGVPR